MIPILKRLIRLYFTVTTPIYYRYEGCWFQYFVMHEGFIVPFLKKDKENKGRGRELIIRTCDMYVSSENVPVVLL